MVLPTLVSLIHQNKSGTQTDISGDFFSAPIFTDTGSGEVNTAIIVLSADNGKYITLAPVIDGYDIIYMNWNDEDNNQYVKTFEVILTVPVQTKNFGTKLELHLVGQEHNLQKINYIKPWYGADAFSVCSDILQEYDTNRGTKQPKPININLTNLQVPNWTVNNYDYGLNQESCYNRLIQTTDKLGGAVASGGILDFFEVDVNTSLGINSPPQMTVSITSSGSQPASPVVITNTTSVNVGPTEGGIQAPRGFLQGAWGDAQSGSLPVSFSQFSSQEVMFGLHSAWNSSVAYPVDARVQYQGIHYKCIVVTPSGPNPAPGTDPTHWVVTTQNIEFGNTITMSPWTKDRYQIWANSGCNPNNLNSGDVRGTGFHDSNLVIWDDKSFRTWVHCRAASDTAIQSDVNLQKYLYGGTNFYRGFRALVTSSSPGGAWAPPDSNNKSFAEAIAEFDGTNWHVKYSAVTNMVVASLYDGSCYKFNGSNWSTDVSTNEYGVDCFHPYSSVINIPGIFGSFDGFGKVLSDTSWTANTNSAVRVEYRFSTATLSINIDDTKNFYQIGGWLNFSFPFPESTFGGISEKVGFYYGGSIQSGGVPDANMEPATLDIQNMHLTHDGFRGFNKQTSTDFGNISSLDFYLRLYYQAPTVLNPPVIGPPDWTKPVQNILESDFKIRCIIFDTSDNVVYQDFVIPFFANWTPIKISPSQCQLYRARRPPATVFGDLVPPKELDANNVFEWRNVKRIVIQTQDSYDDNGRYAPYKIKNLVSTQKWLNPIIVDENLIPIIPPFSIYRRIMLDIDGFRFTKPLLTLTPPVSDRNIEAEFLERPLITLYDNLQNESNTGLAIAKFRHIEYDLETTGKFNITHGNSFYLLDPRIVPNRLSDGSPTFTTDPNGHGDQPGGSGQQGFVDNTVKLVAKRIEYSITKPSDAPGGFIRKIVGIKRFVGT